MSHSSAYARTQAEADAPLWRAAAALRLLTFLYAVGVHLATDEDYRLRTVAWLLFAVLTLWTGAVALGQAQGWGRTWPVAAADVAVTLALMAATPFVSADGWADRQQVLPTTLWTVNPIVSCAILGGPLVGAGAALVVGGANGLVKGHLTFDVERDATVPVLACVPLQR
jgi:hypothetical protein